MDARHHRPTILVAVVAACLAVAALVSWRDSPAPAIGGTSSPNVASTDARHACGHVGMGSGAGFRLTMIGTAARVLVSLQDVMLSANAHHADAARLAPAIELANQVRHASLGCCGCGPGLVVVASATDFAGRRATHAG